MLHDVGATGAGIPIQALPMTHLIILTYVLGILDSHLVFSDLRILSQLEDTSYPHPLHINSISPRIYLYINVHPLDASPRHSEVTMTMRVARQPNRAF
jgi:hypothetical protein